MKRRTLLVLVTILEEKIQEKNKIKYAYFLAKNINLMKNEKGILRKVYADFNNDNNGYTLFEQERIAIAERYSGKDTNGSPIIKDGNYFILDTESFQSEFEALQEKYKDAISLRSKRMAEIDSFLDEDVDIKLHKIKLQDLPDEIDDFLQVLLEAGLVIEE